MTFRPRTFEDARKKYRPMKRRRGPTQSITTNAVLHRSSLRSKPDPELAVWGRAVRERDGNKCQWEVFTGVPCNTGDTRIDPHHKAPRGRRPDLAYVLKNGICLCRTHHSWCHDNPAQAERIGLLSVESYEKARLKPDT